MHLRRHLAIFMALFMLLSVPGAASALDTIFAGPRGLGMAGANVASVNDISAQYYNPAAFAFFSSETENDNNQLEDKDWGFGFDAQAGERLHGKMADYVDMLSDVDLALIENGINDKDGLDQLVKLLGALPGIDDPGNAFSVDANAGFGVRVGHFGIGARGIAQAAGYVEELDLDNLGTTAPIVGDINSVPNVGTDGQRLFFDQTQQDYLEITLGLTSAAVDNLDYLARQNNLDPSQADSMISLLSLIQAGGSGPLSQNDTVALIKGTGYIEVPFTYGAALNEHWGFGINLKYMRGRVYGTQVLVFGSDGEDFLDDLEDNYEETDTYGIDLGVMGRFPLVNVGIVARNLNRPTFKGPTVTNTFLLDDGVTTKTLTRTFDDVTLERQVTAGLALIPLESLTIEADLDLTRNETVQNDYFTQNLAFGLEWNPLNIIALRGGAYKNLAQSDIGWVYTAGLGFNMWLARLDLAAAYGSETVEVDGEDVPKELRGSAQLVIDF